MNRIGYGQGYEVKTCIYFARKHPHVRTLPIDSSVYLVCIHLVHSFVHPDASFASLWNFCPRREARFQQDYTSALCH